MISLEEYLQSVKEWRVPEDNPNLSYDIGCSHYDARKECNQRGMWTIVSLIWAKQLAEWINGRSVIEVMSGAGWTAEALRQCGVTIKATDNFSWQKKKHNKMEKHFDVKKMSALNAVKEYKEWDILLISWAPYNEKEICEVCRHWRKPIIFIGEDMGGCTAVDEFYENFKEDRNVPKFDFLSWSFIYDRIMIGKYAKVYGRRIYEKEEE